MRPFCNDDHVKVHSYSNLTTRPLNSFSFLGPFARLMHVRIFPACPYSSRRWRSKCDPSLSNLEKYMTLYPPHGWRRLRVSSKIMTLLAILTSRLFILYDIIVQPLASQRHNTFMQPQRGLVTHQCLHFTEWHFNPLMFSLLRFAESHAVTSTYVPLPSSQPQLCASLLSIVQLWSYSMILMPSAAHISLQMNLIFARWVTVLVREEQTELSLILFVRKVHTSKFDSIFRRFINYSVSTC